MNGKRIIEYDLAKIKPPTLIAYADRGGWQHIEPYGDVGDIYVLNKSTPNIIIPNSQDLGDYSSVLHRVIEIMADAEERDWDSVARDLILADTNQVRVRLVDAYEDGSISAQAGVTLIQNSWKMIVAAARSAWKPEPVFKGGIESEIRGYLSSVRLGQTEMGSFVVNLFSPSQPAVDTSLRLGESFSDKVVGTLVSGLEATREIVPYLDDFHSSQILEEYVYHGMSANMCDAVAGILSKSGNAGLEVSVNWAIESYASGNKTRSVAFDKSYARLIRRAASTLKEQPEFPDAQLIGKVTALAKRDADRYGKVSIQGYVGDEILSVNMNLGNSDYIKASSAHTRGRTVSITGDLKQVGRGWRLLNPRDLIVDRPSYDLL